MSRYEPMWSEWECVGLDADPTAQLYKAIHVEGCAFHLNAIRIVEREYICDELQTPDPASGFTGGDFHKLSDIFHGSGPWNTVTIWGSRYVIWPEPFSAGNPAAPRDNVIPLLRPR